MVPKKLYRNTLKITLKIHDIPDFSFSNIGIASGNCYYTPYREIFDIKFLQPVVTVPLLQVCHHICFGFFWRIRETIWPIFFLPDETWFGCCSIQCNFGIWQSLIDGLDTQFGWIFLVPLVKIHLNLRAKGEINKMEVKNIKWNPENTAKLSKLSPQRTSV